MDGDVLVNHNNHHGALEQHQNLSGEEDPWSNYNNHSMGDINFSGQVIADAVVTFNLNEWESEEDESNSSEEFMYVKGSTIEAQKKNEQNEADAGLLLSNNVSSGDPAVKVVMPETISWATHEDQIPVAGDKSKCLVFIIVGVLIVYIFSIIFCLESEKGIEEESCDDDASDVEEEFVPSSWDAEAQPARSALKSPDKSSSVSTQHLY